MAGIRGLTSWVGTVLGSPDPVALARFYERLLGWEISIADPTWVTMGMRDREGRGISSNLAFQLEEAHVRPVWPGEPGTQQMQMHLDIGVTDLDGAVADALDIGAELADFQPQEDVRVLLDPDGHPFCLYLDR
ncbi:VOC family protein [Pseudactinotalea terrae]|uniref:VOC family protein n=1 Tax=Pseudactinotalea terrae TaxID=1743262 RepID=UPI0012E1B5E8|nr:VOC family protein [Pseudactinotalea terrae]